MSYMHDIALDEQHAAEDRPFANPSDPGNALRPDVRCLGCGKLGCGTYWGDWCVACNVERIDRISASLLGLARG